MSDYELAMRNALRAVVPLSDQHGCQFHYSQACNRHAKKSPGMLHLVYSKSEPEALILYRKLLYLPLLPADRILDTFNAIALLATNLYPNKFNNFLRYIKHQWSVSINCFETLNSCTQLKVVRMNFVQFH